MAEPKDKRLQTLRAQRRKELRIAKRAQGRGGKRVAARHRKEATLLLRKIRHRRAVLRNPGLIWFDGKKCAAWIVTDQMIPLRKAGVRFTVISGFRTEAEQLALWYHPQGLPVAKPRSLGGTGSKHNGKLYGDGAVDVTPFNALDGHTPRTQDGKRLDSSPPADPPHYSHHDPNGRY